MNQLKQLLTCIILTIICSCSTIDIEIETNNGIRQYKNDSLRTAINTLSKVIAINDTCYNCYLYRGFSYKDIFEYDKALNDFNFLIKLDSNEALGYANRASIYYLKNDYESALVDYSKAYYLDSSFILVNPICHMLFATGQKDEACFYYELALNKGDTTFNEEIRIYCKNKNYR